MSSRQRISKKSNTNLSPSVHNSFQSQDLIAQRAMNFNTAHSQQDSETQQYEQEKFEARKLGIEAKYGIIKPERQERMIAAHGKKADHWQKYLGKTGRFTHEFGMIADSKAAPTIQAKLSIGEPGDKYEQEADSAARQVVEHIHAPAASQNSTDKKQRRMEGKASSRLVKPGKRWQEQTSDEKQGGKPGLTIQRREEGSATSSGYPDLTSAIKGYRGSSQPLATSIRVAMEKAFGADFRGVRIHTGTDADKMNQSIQAMAFTRGEDLFFRRGAYEPWSRRGMELLAHELTHVVQQSKGNGREKEKPGEATYQRKEKVGVESVKKKGLIVENSEAEKVRPYREQKSVKGDGYFIPSVASPIHCHLDISQPHLKINRMNGVDRYDFGNPHELWRMQEAYDVLVSGNYSTISGYEDCEEYLRKQGCVRQERAEEEVINLALPSRIGYTEKGDNTNLLIDSARQKPVRGMIMYPRRD